MEFRIKCDWTPIFSQFGCHLTTPPKLRSWPFLRLFRLKWPTSELQRRGQTTSKLAENWCPVTFWPKLHRGVWGVIPKKIWGGLLSIFLAYTGERAQCTHISINFINGTWSKKSAYLVHIWTVFNVYYNVLQDSKVLEPLFLSGATGRKDPISFVLFGICFHF